MSSRDFDVLIASDFRYSGGTSASIAQEVEVQARMGLRTGLVQIDAPYMSGARWSPRIRSTLVAGYAELVPATEKVSTRLLLLRHPRVFEHARWSLAARPDQTLMVANQVPKDGASATPYYDVAAVQARLSEELRASPRWAPIGPMVRVALSVDPSAPVMVEDDWCNVIDVDAWRLPAERRRKGPIRIGRHSRDNIKKWPDSEGDVLAAYPDSPNYRVRILGGCASIARKLGGKPSHWEVYPFGSLHPREFLAGLDLYSYFHHAGMEEAFGRGVLEALAAGLPVITHRYFERLFADACRYGDPSDVRPMADELAAASRIELNHRGIELVRERYDWDVHARRVRSYLDDGKAAPIRRSARKTRVLFMSSNGGGLGHLTRLLSMARRLPDDFEPMFLTMSTGVAAIAAQGYWVDHIPGPKGGPLRNAEWLAYLEKRVTAAIRNLGPAVVIFDGTFAYRGLTDALGKFPHVLKIWSRRAMWKPISARRQAQAVYQTAAFDIVFEPGEFAHEVDDGFTRQHRDRVSALAPMVLLDEDELLSREEARAELDIAPDAVAVLLSLGAGNINDIDTVVTAVSEILQQHPEVHLVAARSIIAEARLPETGGRISTIETYPLSRVLRAFDFCVAAPGYNSFHELLAHGVPTLFIPNEKTSLDDQLRRARWGQDAGACFCCHDDDSDGLKRALAELMDPDVRRRMRERCKELPVAGGASEALDIIVSRARAAAAEGRLPPPPPEPPSLLARYGAQLAVAVRGVGRGLAIAAASFRRREGSQLRRSRKLTRGRGMASTLCVLGPGALASERFAARLEALQSEGQALVLVAANDLKEAVRRGLPAELLCADMLSEISPSPELAAYALDKTMALTRGYRCRAYEFFDAPELRRVRTLLEDLYGR